MLVRVAHLVFAAGVAGFAFAAVLWQADGNADAEYYIFHLLTPMQGFLAVLLCWITADKWVRDGWSIEVEKIGSLALCALAWWHEVFRGQVLRTADMGGYPEAIQAIASDYRLTARFLLVLTPIIVIRAYTRERWGEWVWLAVVLGLAAAVLWGEDLIISWLTWVYVIAVRLTGA